MTMLTIHRVSRKKLLDKTMGLIKQLAWEAKSRPGIKQKAVSIINQAGVTDTRDRAQTAKALTHWIKQNIQFFFDPYRTETLQTPEKTLEFKYGDCDDMSILLAAFLMSVGTPVRFEVVGRKKPEHIYVGALTEAGWIGLDAARTPKDPRPDQLKTFRIEDYKGYSMKNRNYLGNGGETETDGIGQFALTRTAPVASRWSTRIYDPPGRKRMRERIRRGAFETGPPSRAKFKTFFKGRATDPITQGASEVEKAAGVPVIITATQRTERSAPNVEVTLLHSISPFDISHYEVDPTRRYVSPVLKRDAVTGQEYLAGYAAADDFEMYGVNGWLSVVKKAVVKAGKAVKRTVRRVRRSRAAKAKVPGFVKKLTPKQKMSLSKITGKQVGVKGTINTKDLFSTILNKAKALSASGAMPPGALGLLEAQAAGGNIDEFLETAEKTMTKTRPRAGLPPWALPVLAVGAVYFVTKK